MAQQIKLKRSAIAGKVPLTSSLDTGELAINTSDGKLYFKRDDDTIQTIVTTNTLVTGSLNINGPVTASFFKGDGSAVTGVVSSSYAATSSYTLSALSASYVATASYVNPLTQTLELTGSLLISGSTTQVGSNNLLGNSYLSGSIIVSGSVGIYSSDLIALGGALRLDPGIDPGPVNLTASFLFTSGSNTQTGFDLYYRQNTNLVKFKWLEGGISTGLLYGGVISYSGSTIFVTKGSGIINTSNASTGSEISPQFTYVNWTAYTASATYLTSSQNTYLYVDNAGVVHQQPNYFTETQYQHSIPLGRVTHANYTAITGVGSNVQTTYDDDAQQNEFIRAFGPLKISGLTVTGQAGSLRYDVGSGESYNLGGFYPQDPSHPSAYASTAAYTASLARAYRSGSGIYLDNNAGAFYTTLDPTKYDNGSGTLQNTGGLFSIQRIFYNPVSKRSTVYYGQNTYPTLASAQQSLNTDSFMEGEFTAKSLVFIAYVIIKGGATDITNTGDCQIIQSGIFRNTAGGSASAGIAPSNLDDLGDVTISLPVDGQALIYSSGIWENGTPLNATSASYAVTASHVNTLTQNVSITGDLVVGGRITAEEFHTEFVSASIIYQSGSTKFGNSSDDVHSFTGSLYTTGKVNIGTVDNFGSDPDKFLALTGAEVVYRTGAQLLSDIGGQTAGTFVQNDGSGGQARYIMRYADSNSATTSSIYEDTSGNIGIKTLTPRAGLDLSGSNAVINEHTFGRGSSTELNTIAIGSGSLSTANTVLAGVFIGTNAGKNNTQGESSVVIGNHAAYSGSNLRDSVIIGDYAGARPRLSSTQFPYQDVYIGKYSGYNLNGASNTAIGYSTMYGQNQLSSAQATNNVAVGNFALYGDDFQGNENIGVGVDSLAEIQSGSENIAIGTRALVALKNAIGNTGVGHRAFHNFDNNAAAAPTAQATFNTGLGYYVAYNFLSGSYNTFLGPYAGSSYSTGSRNVIIGYDQASDLNNTEGNLVITAGSKRILHSRDGVTTLSGSLALKGTTTIVQQGILVSGTTSLTVASISTGSYEGAFLDYVIASGSNKRAGTLATVWTPSDIEWNDVSTLDLGSTVGAEFTPTLAGSNANLVLAVPTGTWTVKGHLRYM